MSTEKKTPIYSQEVINQLETVMPVSRDKAFTAACRECVAQGVGVSAMRASLKEYSLGVSNDVASAVHAALSDNQDMTDPEVLTLIEKTRKQVAESAKKARAEKKAEAEQAKAKAEQAEAEQAEQAEGEKVTISIVIVAAIDAAKKVGLTDTQIAAAIAALTDKTVKKA